MVLHSNNLAGFRVYVSSNLPAAGNWCQLHLVQPKQTWCVVAGHGSAVATAEQLSKTETYRDPDSICRHCSWYALIR